MIRSIDTFWCPSTPSSAAALTPPARLIKVSTVVPSPVSNYIFYHFDTVIDILINHQKRHLNQAQNILMLISANK